MTTSWWSKTTLLLPAGETAGAVAAAAVAVVAGADPDPGRGTGSGAGRGVAAGIGIGVAEAAGGGLGQGKIAGTGKRTDKSRGIVKRKDFPLLGITICQVLCLFAIQCMYLYSVLCGTLHFLSFYLSVCSTTLWVGHLSKLVAEDELSDLFGEMGVVNTINLIPPRGCAFVCMNRRMDASRALRKLHKHKLHGKPITVSELITCL